MKCGPVTEAIYGKQDVAAFFERAAAPLIQHECTDCDLNLKICPACWKAGYRGEAPCLCHEVRS
jgi:hypothetical protein